MRITAYSLESRNKAINMNIKIMNELIFRQSISKILEDMIGKW